MTQTTIFEKAIKELYHIWERVKPQNLIRMAQYDKSNGEIQQLGIRL